MSSHLRPSLRLASYVLGGRNKSIGAIYTPELLQKIILLPYFSRNAANGNRNKFETHQDSKYDSDSDDENYRKEYGNSIFWRRKMRTFHGLIDLNKDGVVSIDDFKILSERFISLGHLTPQQQKLFRESLKAVWEEQWGIAHPYNTVTMEQYLSNMHHVLNDKSLKKKSHHFLSSLFQAVDKDKRGFISCEEFKIFFKCLGLDKKEAEHSFSCIDINGDGFLSNYEFVKLGRQFFITEDERKPSKEFWGPLVKP